MSGFLMKSLTSPKSNEKKNLPKSPSDYEKSISSSLAQSNSKPPALADESLSTDTLTKLNVKSPIRLPFDPTRQDTTSMEGLKTPLRDQFTTPESNSVNYMADNYDMTTPQENKNVLNITCGHPKHDKYLESGLINENATLIKIPRRLASIVKVHHRTSICKGCQKQIDNDPEYTTHPQYESPKSIRKQKVLKNLGIAMVGYDQYGQ